MGSRIVWNSSSLTVDELGQEIILQNCCHYRSEAVQTIKLTSPWRDNFLNFQKEPKVLDNFCLKNKDSGFVLNAAMNMKLNSSLLSLRPSISNFPTTYFQVYSPSKTHIPFNLLTHRKFLFHKHTFPSSMTKTVSAPFLFPLSNTQSLFVCPENLSSF